MGAEGTSNACPPRRPRGEVAFLLKELRTHAARFDARDYWMNGSWDLEALREDADLQCNDHWSHEETLWQTDAVSSAIDSPRKRATTPLPERSPSPEYPIFAEVQSQRLAFTLSRGFRTASNLGRFAKSSLRADSD